MNSKSNTQAMETEKIPRLLAQLAIPAVVAMQLLAYYVSADKGLDVDKPRNLAKSVTVE